MDGAQSKYLSRTVGTVVSRSEAPNIAASLKIYIHNWLRLSEQAKRLVARMKIDGEEPLCVVS